MTDTISLLTDAANANPHEDVPLLMLADEYAERGDHYRAAILRAEVDLRKVSRDGLAVLRPFCQQLVELGEAFASDMLKIALQLKDDKQ